MKASAFGPMNQQCHERHWKKQWEPNDRPANQQMRYRGRFSFGVDHRQSENGVTSGDAERESQELNQGYGAQYHHERNS